MTNKEYFEFKAVKAKLDLMDDLIYEMNKKRAELKRKFEILGEIK